MKHRLLSILMASLLLLTLWVPLSAAADNSGYGVNQTFAGDELVLIDDSAAQEAAGSLAENISGYIRDSAGLLTESEKEILEEKAKSISEQYGCGIYVHTVDSIGSMDIRSYTEQYYNDNNLGLGSYRNGLVLTLAMASRDYDLSGYGHNPEDFYDFGNGLTAFTDYGRQKMVEDFLPDLSDGYYYDAFRTYLKLSEKYLELDAKGTPFDEGSDRSILVPLLITVLVPLLIALVVCMLFLGEMNTAKAATEARDYIPSDGFQLTNQVDQYTHTTQTRRHIERDSSSHGGGTSVSSGGFSHTSGKF